MTRVLGAVLAGGASSRFGSDKALAMLAGRTLVDHALAALATVTDAVVVVGRGDVADLPAPGLGPLGGIAGALDHAARGGFASAMTIACDMPGVPPALLAALREAAPSYCADAPVLGHWPVSLAPALLDRLRSATPSPAEGPPVAAPARHRRGGARSVRGWAEAIGAVGIPSPLPLANVNAPADLPR